MPNPLPITVDLPLLDELRLADRELIEKFPGEPWNVGLTALGMRLYDKLDEVRYPDVTPINCVTFGGSGGDGAHNSLAVCEGKITVRSCVVMSMPADGGFSIIAGENLYDFLCLGVGCGSFAIMDVGVRDSIVSLTDHSERDLTNGFCNRRQREMLRWLVERLQLRPWADRSRYQALQDRFFHLIEVPPFEL